MLRATVRSHTTIARFKPLAVVRHKFIDRWRSLGVRVGSSRDAEVAQTSSETDRASPTRVLYAWMSQDTTGDDFE